MSKKILDKCCEDLIWFGRKMAPWEFHEESPEFHYEIAKQLIDPKIRKLVVQAPRGHAKSTVIRTFIFWHIFLSDLAYGRESYPKTITILTKTGGAAFDEMRKIKRVLNDSKFLHQLFGYQGKEVCQSWTWNKVILPGGHTISYRGGGQQARMLRTTLAIGDDLEDEGNTKTPEALDKNYSAFVGGYINTLDLFRGDKVVCIGTPVSANCTVERLLDLSKKKGDEEIEMADGSKIRARWKGMHYSAIVRDDPNGPLEEGRPLWPEARSMEFMLEEKAEAEESAKLSLWYSEQMCQIVSDLDKFFENWGYYRGELEMHHGKHYLRITHRSQQSHSRHVRLETLKELEKPELVPVNVFMGVDPASSTHARADRSVVMPEALDKSENRFILPYFAGRKKPLEVADQVEILHNRYNPIRTNVETVAWQTALKDILIQRGLVGVCDGGKPKEKKDDRLGNGLQPMFGQKKVWLQPESMGLLETELDLFPNNGPRDCLDALYYADTTAYTPMHGSPDEITQKKKGRRRRDRTSFWASP